MLNQQNLPNQSLLLKIKPNFSIRLLDLLVAIPGLILLAPIFGLIAAAIKLTSPGSVFYLATRVGQDGQLFKLYKFRTMVANADRQGPGITTHNDARITPVGRFLRQTKLDELPQLINVVRGEMSLVGPRPEDPRYVELYTPEQRQVLQVRPGLTSLASLYYHDEETLLAGPNWEKQYREQLLPHKLALDLAYLRKRSFWSDLGVMLRTVVAISRGDNSVQFILKLRNRHFFVLDILLLLLLPALALTLRLDGMGRWAVSSQALIVYTITALVVKLTIFYRCRLYARYWRYASIHDLILVALAVSLSTVALTVLFIILHPLLMPYGLAVYRTVPIIDGLLTLFAIAGLRLGLRGLYHFHQRQSPIGGRRVLVIGAGEAGSLVVKEMLANPQLEMEPVAFVDDDPAKVGTHIQNLPVIGTCQEIERLVNTYQIHRLVVALPSAPLSRQKAIIQTCRQTGRTIYSLPGVYELLAGHKTISHLPQVDIQRLLQREPVDIDHTEVSALLRGATVLVTGAGGSIGSELCRQIARCRPKAVVLLGHGENSIFEISLDLRLTFPDLVTYPAIVDVRDKARVDRTIKQYKPDIIFHAAAHKHVPFMQENTEEALTNNVQGTQNVLEAAEAHGVKRFLLISTDKAVNPTSVMGATKRLAELLVIGTAQRTGRAYMAVRFGNVLGSRGSVIPIFQRQIAAGGPVTITHPDMERYFMTIPEAVQLVLQSIVLGRGGEVFVLDMGHQVRIETLAADLIKLSGLELGRDIDIVYSGIRPGEKLREELFLDNETYSRTRHQKIFIARDAVQVELEPLKRAIRKLINVARAPYPPVTDSHEEYLIVRLNQVIKQYQPYRNGQRRPINPRTVTSDTVPKLV